MAMPAEPSSADYPRQFEENYDKLNYARNMASRVLARSHVVLEKQFGQNDHFAEILEVGAGSGRHLETVRHGFNA